MTISTFIPALAILGGLAAVFGTLLAVASKILHVDIDPRIEEIENALPNTNCAVCGFVGCSSYAQALAAGEAGADGCKAGGIEVKQALAKIMGVEVELGLPEKAYVLCRGSESISPKRFEYQGIKECRIANMSAGGDKSCTYGCLGYGSCTTVCPYDLIKMNENGLPDIDRSECTGCGACVDICPRDVIGLIAENTTPYVACKSHDKAKECRTNCILDKKPIGCIGCKACMKVCEPNAIEFENELVVIDPEKCNNCGECVKKCPTNCILTRQLDQIDFNEDQIKETSIEQKETILA